MGNIWKAFCNWLDQFRMDMALLDIENAYRKAGHPNPRLAANEELFIRAEYIERFRDDASRMYLRGVPLNEYKETWINRNLNSEYAALDTVTLENVRAVIRDMPADEAFYGEALRKHAHELDQWTAEVQAAAKKKYGPSGLTPRMQRVLRGRDKR